MFTKWLMNSDLSVTYKTNTVCRSEADVMLNCGWETSWQFVCSLPPSLARVKPLLSSQSYSSFIITCTSVWTMVNINHDCLQLTMPPINHDCLQYRSGMVCFHQPVILGPLIENRLLEKGAKNNLISCGKYQQISRIFWFWFILQPGLGTVLQKLASPFSPIST